MRAVRGLRARRAGPAAPGRGAGDRHAARTRRRAGVLAGRRTGRGQDRRAVRAGDGAPGGAGPRGRPERPPAWLGDRVIPGTRARHRLAATGGTCRAIPPSPPRGAAARQVRAANPLFAFGYSFPCLAALVLWRDTHATR